MGFMDEYNALKKKRKEEETETSEASFMESYNELKAQRTENELNDQQPVNLDGIYYEDNVYRIPYTPIDPNDNLLGKAVTGYGNVLAAIVNNAKPNPDRPRDATFWDLTWNSFNRGIYNSKFGEESFAAMQGLENDRAVYKQILSGDEYNFEPEGWFAEGVSGAFEQLGQLAHQITNPRTIGVAAGAGGAAAIAGQLGPQALLPEEIITVPAAVLTGLSAGNAASALEIEAGHAYNEMIELGISHETASKVALGVGTLNAGLEAVQLDTLLDAYKIASKSGAGKSITKKIFKELVDRGVDVAKETGQEVAQEVITMGGVQIANKAEKGESAYTFEEVKDRLLDTLKQSALTFGMMNVPAAVKNTAVSSYQQSTANKLTDNEQKVVDKVVEDEIANREQDGTKVSGSLPRPYTYAGKYTTAFKCSSIYGISKGKKLFDDFRPTRELEIQIWE